METGGILQEIAPLCENDLMSVADRQEADSLLNLAAEQGYKPAIKTRECFKECRGEE